MSELMDKILKGKEAWREELASLPFEEKIVIAERLRDLAKSIAAHPMRTRQLQNLEKVPPSAEKPESGPSIPDSPETQATPSSSPAK